MNAKEYYERAEKHFSEKNYDKAITDMAESIKLDSKNPLAYHNRGFAYKEKKEYDLAIADFNEAIRLEPDKYGNFYYARGCTYYLKEDKAKAISDFEMAIKIEPENECYKEELEAIKSGKVSFTSSKNNNFIKFLIVIIAGGVVGGLMGGIVSSYILIGILIGAFLGIGIGQFISATIAVIAKEVIIEGPKAYQKHAAETGAIKGFFLTLFISVIFVFFKIIWRLIKSPFITIYKLINRDYVIFDVNKEINEEIG